MGANTAIEWAHHTFNPWLGCTKISPACDHCYAEAWAKRTGHPELWQGDRRFTSEANWRQPPKWNAAATAAGERHRVFCASLADVFDNQVPAHWRYELWQLIRSTTSLDWLLLTKRPQNIAAMLPQDWGDGFANVWLGTTVENQDEACRRLPHLLDVAARIRFLSCEPLLEAVRIFPEGRTPGDVGGIHWLIVGGESGPHARPMHPEWARTLRDQCLHAGVVFHFKQWGEWGLVDDDHPRGELVGIDPEIQEHDCAFSRLDAVTMAPIGKKAAGRVLDGRTHDEFPKPEEMRR
jgi:protein gp37